MANALEITNLIEQAKQHEADYEVKQEIVRNAERTSRAAKEKATETWNQIYDLLVQLEEDCTYQSAYVDSKLHLLMELRDKSARLRE